MNPQKQHERFLLERFIEAASFDAQIVEEREAPDFIVRVEGRTVGVEVTELFINHDASQSPLQVQESISTRIVLRARQIYEESGASPVQVKVCFRPGRDLRQLNMKETASDLACFVQCLGLIECQRVVRPSGSGDPLPDEISYVQALGVPRLEMAHWAVARAGWVAPLTPAALQLRIDDKASRLQDYSEVVTETWLLIVADTTKPSQSMEAKADFNPHVVSSPFPRTFFYRYPEKRVIELGGFGCDSQ